MAVKREGLAIPLAKSLTGEWFYASDFSGAQSAAQLNRIHQFACPCCEQNLVVARDRVSLHFKHHAKNADNASCTLYTGANADRGRRWRKQDAIEAWQKRFPQGIAVSQQWTRIGFENLVEQFTKGLSFDFARRLSMNRNSFRTQCARNGALVREVVEYSYLTQPQRHYPVVSGTAHAQRTQMLWKRLVGPADDAQDMRNLLFLVAAWRAYEYVKKPRSIEPPPVKQFLKVMATGRDDELRVALDATPIPDFRRVAMLIAKQAAFLIHHFPFIEAHKAQLRQDFGTGVASGARYVYFMVDSDRNDWAKIGIADSPSERARQLETATPGKMLVMDAALFIGATTAEIRIRHAMRKRCGGAAEKEWVQLNGMSMRGALELFRKLSHDQMLMDALSLPKVPESELVAGPPPDMPGDPFAPLGSNRRW